MKPTQPIKLARRHVNRIKSLYKDGFTILELHIMYNEIIPPRQLRSLVKDIKRPERI